MGCLRVQLLNLEQGTLDCRILCCVVRGSRDPYAADRLPCRDCWEEGLNHGICTLVRRNTLAMFPDYSKTETGLESVLEPDYVGRGWAVASLR